jgi:hypothetical protein
MGSFVVGFGRGFTAVVISYAIYKGMEHYTAKRGQL